VGSESAGAGAEEGAGEGAGAEAGEGVVVEGVVFCRLRTAALARAAIAPAGPPFGGVNVFEVDNGVFAFDDEDDIGTCLTATRFASSSKKLGKKTKNIHTESAFRECSSNSSFSLIF
jgi:hypothetical protein